ncbi:hypothetical protein JB92DRAFT_2058847 [Gautieria morchelliformis]|nr:hypothetical protein JB92DRAFT_2058847 [Gautieria morchelliformis]
MSTPTFKPVHLPDLSVSPVPIHTPLPPSPPSPMAAKRGPARADVDLARLQRAVAPNFIFPERPSLPSPVPSPPGSSLAKASQQAVSTISSKPQSWNPPPQVESSELPDAHSFLVEQTRTPLKSEPRHTSPVLKTPRIPGAFGTPGPFNSLLQVVGPAHYEDDLEEEAEATPRITPKDDLPPTHIQTNGSAFVLPTPTPPGAYRATPTPAKRKGILKVRFDGDVQTPEDIVEKPFTGVFSTGNSKSGSSPHSSSSETDVPPSNLSPSRRKGLRLVDEYGRARRFTEDGEEIILDSRRKRANIGEPVKTAVPDDTTMRSWRRAKIDAQGNEITDDAGSKPEGEPNRKAESQRKGPVLSRLARSLVKLQDDVAEEENALASSVPVNGQRDDGRMVDLATVSKTARVERNKLARKLQLERHAEDGIADNAILVARNARQDPVR